MNIIEIVEKLNNGMTLKQVSEEIEISKNTLGTRLKKEGFSYDKSQKKWDKNSLEKTPRNANVSDDSLKEVLQKIEEIEKELSEIKKKEVRNISDLKMKLLELPNVTKDGMKKHSINISEKTLNDFSSFCEGVKNQRISQNELIEISLIEFMNKYK